VGARNIEHSPNASGLGEARHVKRQVDVDPFEFGTWRLDIVIQHGQVDKQVGASGTLGNILIAACDLAGEHFAKFLGIAAGYDDDDPQTFEQRDELLPETPRSAGYDDAGLDGREMDLGHSFSLSC
jgi:hypothetical protein